MKGAYRGIRVAMVYRWTVAHQSLLMYGGTVAFVGCIPVVRCQRVELLHDAITGDFGDNRGCGDAQGAAVAVYETALGNRPVWERYGIDKERINRNRQPKDCLLHGNTCRLNDAHAVNIVCTDPSDGSAPDIRLH